MSPRAPAESANDAPASPAAERAHGGRGLALAFQETLTATMRLRANRQSTTDAESFRNHIKQLLSTAHEEARRTGYAGEDVKLAIYAVVAFLDESVLSSRHPAFAEWPSRPLQEEVFGGHTGGETFFQNLDALLRRQDTVDTADVVEVYQLCLLLGFRGRYGGSGSDEVRAWTTASAEKIGRVRGRDGGRGSGSLSPAWAPPGDETIPVPKDPWLRPLGYAGIGVFALTCLLSLLFWFWQHSWIADLRSAVR